MGQDHIEQHRRYIVISYAFMFLALFTVIFAAFAYLVARKVAVVDDAEVWIHAHALWIMRNGILFLLMSVLLWSGLFLSSFAWDSNLWVTASTVAGVVLVLLLGYFIKCMVKRLV